MVTLSSPTDGGSLVNFPDGLVQGFVNQDVAGFVGAGLSVGSGLPGWKQVASSLAEGIPECPPDASPPEVAQYYENEHGRNMLLRRLRERLQDGDMEPTAAHMALVRLPITRIFTTNWDTLIERSLQAAGRRFDLVVNEEDVSLTSEGDTLLLVKLHGCIQQPNSMIVTARDYEGFAKRHPAIRRQLMAAFHTRTLLLLGYSATDPDFRQLRTLVRDEVGQLARHAFAVQFDAPRPVRKDLEARGIHVVALDEAPSRDAVPETSRPDPRTRALTRWLLALARHVAVMPSPRTQARRGQAPEPVPFRLADELEFWLEATRYEDIDRQSQAPSHVDVLARLPEGLRLLVRCVVGEVTVQGVRELEDACRVQGAALGWAVSETRASPAAREYASLTESLKVFTLSDFVRDVLSPYQRYLRERIRDSGILKYYVDLACSKPVIDDQGGGVLTATEYDRYPVIDDYVDSWLNETGRDHISILGEFGQGKTWFCLRYADRKLDQYIADPRRRLPLLIPLRGYRNTNMRELIPHLFVNTYGLHFRNGYEIFDRLNRSGRLLIIFDGFDEMAPKVDYQVTLKNYQVIADIVVPDRSKVILTSRTPYFRNMLEEKAVLAGGDTPGSSHDRPHFEVIYIDELDDTRIAEVLRRRVGAQWGDYLQTIRAVYDLPNLAQRPVMLDMIIQTLPRLKSLEEIDHALLYTTYTDQWINKEIDEERALLDAESKRLFAQEVAWDMFRRGELTIHSDRMRELVDQHLRLNVRQSEDIIFLEHDARTASFISSRDEMGNYEFMHRSFMEFFVAQKLAAAISRNDNGPLAEQLIYYEILRFLDQMLRPAEDRLTLSRWRDQRTSNETLRANCIRLSGQWVNEDALRNLMAIAQDRRELSSLRRDAIRSITRILRGDESDWGEHDVRVTLWAFAIRTSRDTLNVIRLPIRIRVVDPGAATGERAKLVEALSSTVATTLLGCLRADEPEEVRTNASYALIHLPGWYEPERLADLMRADASMYVRFNCCTALIAASFAPARAMLEGMLASAEDADLVRLGQSNLSMLENGWEGYAKEDSG